MTFRLIGATCAVATCAWYMGPLTTLVGFLLFAAAPMLYMAYIHRDGTEFDESKFPR